MVLVVDDHPVVRQGFAGLLGTQPWVTRVVPAGTAADARRLATLEAPALAIVDLGLPDAEGTELIRQLHAAVPRCALVVATMSNHAELVHAALADGARGYLLKDTEPDAVLACLAAVRAGARVIGPGVAAEASPAGGPAPRPAGPAGDLTPREERLLALIGAGKRNQEIAAELSVSEKTARNLVALLIAKLGVTDRVQAALLANRR
ncbi:LuxR family two component transcriptional regulator [Pseudosporangium ferrugineum]|uniref:LuxR family two component transcriptional regulator n=1 Tax=Pseudosporangium ferrugineum TaxID=439699 RepID=A0A2T0RXR0_9ACTN|nr:LuxR family two component transcriptional regulator [Pseudosporangium ferrugineum]